MTGEAQGEFRSTISGDIEHPVVRFSGPLDRVSVTTLSTTVLKVLLGRPTSVIMDFSRVRVTEKILLTSLITAGHHAAAWPGCRLALVGANRDTATALHHMGVTRYITLSEDYADARRQLSALAPLPRLRESLLPIASAPEVARDRTHEVCELWGVPEVADAVATVATEFVTNAVVHARTSMELSFALAHPLLYVCVRDRDPRLPSFREAEDHGFGLRLVDAFAAYWGAETLPGGKIVWAAVRLPYGGRRAPAEGLRR